MRRLARPTLPLDATAYLARKTAELMLAGADVTTARSSFKSAKRTAAFRDIRESLESMARGRLRCFYCEDSAPTHIDHFEPIKRSPLGAFTWANYLLACSRCNSNYKRDEYPLDAAGNVLLVNPVTEDPLLHLNYSADIGEFGWRTEKGRRTIEVFGLNDGDLPQGRVDAWVTICALIPRYADACDSGDTAEADALLRSISDVSFGMVLSVIGRWARSGVPLLGEGIARAVRDRTELGLIFAD